MKNRWKAYKKILVFRLQSEALKNASKKLDKHLSQFLENSQAYDIKRENAKILKLVDLFLNYINEYEIFLLNYTSMNPERIRKLLWQCKYGSFEEQYAVVDNIYRFMQSIQDGNIIGGLGKKELVFIVLFIVSIEICIYILYT